MFSERDYAKAEPFINRLRECVKYRKITIQQLRTLKGQALNGDLEGAEKGLRKLLGRER